MVALDTYQDNLCLWRCIAVHRGARVDRSTKEARGLAKSFFKLKKMPAELPKTSLDDLSWEVGRIDDVDLPKVETKSYPHVILYDFEAYGDNNHRKEPTPTLTIENAHVPISVSVGDTLEREPTHICERDPAELVRKFMEELERRGKNFQDQVRAEFVPEDVHLLPKAQREKI